MRLLNTSMISPAEVFKEPFPPYAIVSHRWDATEISFQDMMSAHESLTGQSGWSKIANCCARAAEDGWEYVWIDSCCIDKSGRAELSKCVNSICRWYENAQVCYACLSDVPGGEADFGHYILRPANVNGLREAGRCKGG